MNTPLPAPALDAGWKSWLARTAMIGLLFECISGLAITLGPFSPSMQWNVLVHTLAGVLALIPFSYYGMKHWHVYRLHPWSQVVLLGWVGVLGLLVCSTSGVVLTWQGLLGIRTSDTWRQMHLVTTVITLVGVVPHVVIVAIKVMRHEAGRAARGYVGMTFLGTALGCAAILLTSRWQIPPPLHNQFPSDYSYLYGTNRPFAPSLAKTDTGGAFDQRSLAGSASCGTSGCHEQILSEWKPSAHRYAAMDTVFQGIQTVMAKQNGPESTRYCGGCHDPISLFSGTKNIFADNLTGLAGYQEGISCLSCHAIRETDVKGNANYTVTQPREYLWQWATNGWERVARDFLIRAYPTEHNRLSKRMFKKPEYCAACHKQFIDQEVNRVGWVQLQNQYDNWAASHWNKKGDPRKTVECRECHMPLVASTDPAAGDSLDYNRTPGDRKHRSHRFIAANSLMPVALKKQLEGWDEQFRLTEQWLQGKLSVPEIADKWANGPIVDISLQAPATVSADSKIPLRVVMSSTKVGHDFPTGPLDIIQSWIEVHVKDASGREVFASGRRDEKNFIEPGTFLFKAEPVDQHGNLIDRHNLWEMVGVRYRRALFPGYSDTVQMMIPCSGGLSQLGTNAPAAPKPADGKLEPQVDVPAPAQPGRYEISVSLQYRKVDQFLLNFLLGATNQLTSPVTEIARAAASVEVVPAGKLTSLAHE